MMMGKDVDWAMHAKWMGVKMLIVGILVIWNTYRPFMDWVGLLGVLLVVGGLCKIAMPCCKKK